MFYRTEDNKLINLDLLSEVFFTKDKETVSSKMGAQGSMGTSVVTVDVLSDTLTFLGKKTKAGLFGKEKEVEVMLDRNVTAMDMIRMLPQMVGMGIDAISQINITPNSVYPLRSTPAEWWKSQGLDPDKVTEEDSKENALRKSPIFTVDVSLHIFPYDGATKPFVITSRNVPFMVAIHFLNTSQLNTYLPNRSVYQLTQQDFENAVPAGEWSHYMKEEYHRLMHGKPSKK